MHLRIIIIGDFRLSVPLLPDCVPIQIFRGNGSKKFQKVSVIIDRQIKARQCVMSPCGPAIFWQRTLLNTSLFFALCICDWYCQPFKCQYFEIRLVSSQYRYLGLLLECFQYIQHKCAHLLALLSLLLLLMYICISLS